jgi:signal peptide peptidase SppA
LGHTDDAVERIGHGFAVYRAGCEGLIMDTAAAYKLLQSESALWAMAPEHLESVAAVIASGVKMAARSHPVAVAPSGTAIVPIMGPLSRRPSFLSELFGMGDAGSYQGIRRRLNEALADKSISRIILLVDSPGGAALGVEELAADIRAANSQKPITAVVDVLMGSAALWLGAQAGRVVATPSAEIGSVGAFMLHIDTSRALDRLGLAPTFITSKISPHKTEGNAFEPLGKEAHAHLQGQIDELAGKFVRDLARGRGVSTSHVTTQFGRGRTMFAADAKRVGLVDDVGTIETVLAGRDPIARPLARRGAGTGNTPPRSARSRRLQLLAQG